jgi:peptidoglycan/LPS O-acetylase OafA/YrhL
MLLADNQSRIFTLWRYFLFGILASEISPNLSRRAAITCATIGIALIIVDFRGPPWDWAAKIGIGVEHPDVQTFGLGLGIGFLLAGLPHLEFLGRVLSWLPLQMLGVISYSVYITHFFYIKANFPEITLFTVLGTQEMYKLFSTQHQFAALYLPLVFFPGALFWGAVSFLLVERPGIMLGRYIVSLDRTASPAQIVANPLRD